MSTYVGFYRTSFLPGQLLTVADLPQLMRVLSKAARHSFMLGVQLGLSPDRLVTLRHQSMGNPFVHLSLVLIRWLERSSEPATLQALIDAVSHPPISDEALAYSLKQTLYSKFFCNNCIFK